MFIKWSSVCEGNCCLHASNAKKKSFTQTTTTNHESRNNTFMAAAAHSHADDSLLGEKKSAHSASPSSTSSSSSNSAPSSSTTAKSQALQIDDVVAHELSQMIGRVVNLAHLVPSLHAICQKFQLEQAAAAVSFERQPSEMQRELVREQHFVDGLKRGFDFCLAAARESLRKAVSIGVSRSLQQQPHPQQENSQATHQNHSTQEESANNNSNNNNGSRCPSPNSQSGLSSSSAEQNHALSPETAALLTAQQQQKEQEHKSSNNTRSTSPLASAPLHPQQEQSPKLVAGTVGEGVAMFQMHNNHHHHDHMNSSSANNHPSLMSMADRANSMPHLASFNSCDEMGMDGMANSSSGADISDGVIQCIAELNHYSVQTMMQCLVVSRRADIRRILQAHAVQTGTVVQYLRSALATMREVELAWFAEGYRTQHMNLLCNLLFESPMAGQALLDCDGLLGIVLFHTQRLDPENPGLNEWSGFTLRCLTQAVGAPAAEAISLLKQSAASAASAAASSGAGGGAVQAQRSSSGGSVASSSAD